MMCTAPSFLQLLKHCFSRSSLPRQQIPVSPSSLRRPIPLCAILIPSCLFLLALLNAIPSSRAHGLLLSCPRTHRRQHRSREANSEREEMLPVCPSPPGSWPASSSPPPAVSISACAPAGVRARLSAQRRRSEQEEEGRKNEESV
eukprot:1932735-Rhodomonas_salina.3